MKFKDYKGKLPPGRVRISEKIDGVRVEYKDGVPLSRTGKPLYNLPHGLTGTYEVFLGDFKQTVQRVRNKTDDLPEISRDDLYCLDPVDRRLTYGSRDVMDDELIQIYAQPIWNRGGEGIIIHHLESDIRYKVKKTLTVDPVVLDWIEGTGKYKGIMGALLTTMGKVGTGFTDVDRQRIDKSIIGKTIECKCMEITEGGKMRMPVFLRERPDKD